MYCVSEVLLSSLSQVIVCGDPTVIVRPKTEQNFRRNEQAGGGAYVSGLKSTAQETEFATEVLHRVRVTLAECGN